MGGNTVEIVVLKFAAHTHFITLAGVRVGRHFGSTLFDVLCFKYPIIGQVLYITIYGYIQNQFMISEKFVLIPLHNDDDDNDG